MEDEVETGHGSEFHLADAAGVLTELGQLVSVPIPSGSADLIRSSHMKTVDFHEYISAPLRDGEEADLEMNWLPGSATDALCVEAEGKRRAFKIVIPAEGGDRQFTGTVLVRKYVRSNPMEDRRTGTLTVKWIGAIVESAVPVGP